MDASPCIHHSVRFLRECSALFPPCCAAQVLLLSAQDAMLARIVLSGRAGREERLRFGKLAFGARRAHSTPEAEYQARTSTGTQRPHAPAWHSLVDCWAF